MNFILGRTAPSLRRTLIASRTPFFIKHIDTFKLGDSLLSKLIAFLYLQLISDILANRAQNEHVVHVINRLKAKKGDIDKIFDLESDAAFGKATLLSLAWRTSI